MSTDLVLTMASGLRMRRRMRSDLDCACVVIAVSSRVRASWRVLAMLADLGCVSWRRSLSREMDYLTR